MRPRGDILSGDIRSVHLYCRCRKVFVRGGFFCLRSFHSGRHAEAGHGFLAASGLETPLIPAAGAVFRQERRRLRDTNRVGTCLPPDRGDLFLGRNLPCRKGAGRHPSCTFPRPPQTPEGLGRSKLAAVTPLCSVWCGSNSRAIRYPPSADGLRVGLQYKKRCAPSMYTGWSGKCQK